MHGSLREEIEGLTLDEMKLLGKLHLFITNQPHIAGLYTSLLFEKCGPTS